ncbi:MAG: ATP-dependent DNA helicase RecQ [Bacteroidota bacterium]
MPTPHSILQQYWKYPAFRPMQEEIVQSVLEGKDTLALLPTGGGKSICFQVPGMMLKGLTIVISPLIALMKDQVEQLQHRGIKAAAIYSGIPRREIDILLDNCIYGDIKFLYVSPERLKSELFLERSGKMNVSLLAIDEAHCISQWGYDFRPSYLEISDFKSRLPEAKIIALTATATTEVKEDIIDKLQLNNPQVFQKSFARKNLSYSVRIEENKEQKLLEVLKSVQGSSIVYVRNRGKTKQLAEYIRKNGISSDFYHAGLSNEVRARRQERWINDQIRVMVCTNAFGMGIDKPNVRLVIHMDIPDSMEAYYQEAGRGGRDEKLAYAILIAHPVDGDKLLEQTQRAHPTIDYLKTVYQSLSNYYKIAVGSNLLSSFDFDLEEFTIQYKLNPYEAYNALKKLEEEGLVQLNESFYKPSRLMFLIDTQELYKYQVAHESLDPLLKALLRLYGGELFTSFMTISETNLAKLVKVSKAEIIKKLEFLHQNEVLIYEHQKEKPQLTFTTARQDANRLVIDIKRLEQRKSSTLTRVRKMIDYTYQNSQCRTQQFQIYFGELTTLNCGNCDVCIQRKKELKGNAEAKNYPPQILQLLASVDLQIDDLRSKVNPSDNHHFFEILRELNETHQIQISSTGLISLA